MTTTTMTDRTATLNFVRGWLTKLLETLSDEQMMHQPTPTANHALWVMGHLAWCDDLFCSQIGGKASTAPPEWKALFGDGSEPMADASKYPSVAVLRKAFEKNRAALLAWIDGLDESKMSEPLPDDWKPFAPTFGALMNTIAAHEAVHLGQVTVVRKSLGMKPAMM